MEDRLISANELFREISSREAWNVPDFVYECINNAPIVNTQKHGHWVKHGEEEYNCSKCGAHWEADEATVKSFRYCSWCGARMDEERKEDAEKTD